MVSQRLRAFLDDGVKVVQCLGELDTAYLSSLGPSPPARCGQSPTLRRGNSAGVELIKDVIVFPRGRVEGQELGYLRWDDDLFIKKGACREDKVL